MADRRSATRRLLDAVARLVEAASALIDADEGGARHLPPSPIPETTGTLASSAVRAVEVLLSTVEPEESTELYGSGPVDPGTRIVEDVPEGASGTTLTVPALPGDLYVFLLDDEPGKKFEHAVRYAWVHPDTGKVEAREARRPFTLQVPDRAPVPFEATASGRVNGIPVVFGSGDFAGRVAEVLTEKSSDGPDREETGVAGGDEDVAEEVEIGGDEETEGSPTIGAGGCIKLARICDLGDKNGYFSTLADNMAEDADAIGGWLTGQGWKVSRTSQYWGNTHAGYTGKRLKSRFLDTIRADGARLKRANKDIDAKKCCHEYFLFLSAHGNSKSLSVYDFDGKGTKESLKFTEVFDAISASFPNNVHLIVFVDACESGGLITTFRKGYRKASCKKFCGVTLLTVTDDKTSAAGGQVTDSGAEDFMEGAAKDLDMDGKKGDIQDRFKEMVRQGSSYNPQWFHCGPGIWGSLD